MKKLFTAVVMVLGYSMGINAQPGNPDNPENISVIYLVRHAEPVPPPYNENPPNPGLGENGKERAALLAHLLSDAHIATIYSTNLNRTKETAEPLRAQLNTTLQYYDLKTMQDIADIMRATPGVYLVTGHSNTTPQMVKLLGGDPGDPINENEFDRLYVVTIIDGQVSTVLLRYGSPFHKE